MKELVDSAEKKLPWLAPSLIVYKADNTSAKDAFNAAELADTVGPS